MEAIGEHIYGCNVYQDVFTWNVTFAQQLNLQCSRAYVAGTMNACCMPRSKWYL